jgi:hypothetical protein
LVPGRVAEEDEFISKDAQAQIKSALAEVTGATVFRTDAFLWQQLTPP